MNNTPIFPIAFNIAQATDSSALKYICHLNIIVFFKGGGDIQRSFVLYLKETKRKIVDHSKQFVAICLFETFACPQTSGDLFRISGIQFQVCKVFATCNIWNLKCEVFYWSVSIYFIIMKWSITLYDIWWDTMLKITLDSQTLILYFSINCI